MRRLERHDEGVIVDLAPAGDKARHAHAVKVGIGAVGIIVERILRISLTVQGEQDIVRVEVAARRETLDGVKLHAMAQVERVSETVVGNLPLFRQAGAHLGGARLELDDAVVERGGGGVASAGSERRVERIGTGLGAIDQGLGHGLMDRREQKKRGQQQNEVPACHDPPRVGMTLAEAGTDRK